MTSVDTSQHSDPEPTGLADIPEIFQRQCKEGAMVVDQIKTKLTRQQALDQNDLDRLATAVQSILQASHNHAALDVYLEPVLELAATAQEAVDQSLSGVPQKIVQGRRRLLELLARVLPNADSPLAQPFIGKPVRECRLHLQVLEKLVEASSQWLSQHEPSPEILSFYQKIISIFIQVGNTYGDHRTTYNLLERNTLENQLLEIFKELFEAYSIFWENDRDNLLEQTVKDELQQTFYRLPILKRYMLKEKTGFYFSVARSASHLTPSRTPRGAVTREELPELEEEE